jgi:hypothetical protein
LSARLLPSTCSALTTTKTGKHGRGRCPRRRAGRRGDPGGERAPRRNGRRCAGRGSGGGALLTLAATTLAQPATAVSQPAAAVAQSATALAQASATLAQARRRPRPNQVGRFSGKKKDRKKGKKREGGEEEMEEEEVGGTPSSLPKKVGKRKIIQHSWPAEGPLALVPFGIDPDSAEEKVGQPMLITRCSLSLALTLTLTPPLPRPSARPGLPSSAAWRRRRPSIRRRSARGARSARPSSGCRPPSPPPRRLRRAW